MSRAKIGLRHYPPSPAEAAAGVTIVDFAIRYGDVRRYGKITGSSGADTAAVQAAINQAKQAGGEPWHIPRGVTCSVQTSGSTASPVDAALTIDAACHGIIDGRLVGANNCHVILCTASDVSVAGRGSIEGYGSYFQTGSGNGALFKNSGGNNVILEVERLVEPPQYGVWYRGAAATGGRVGKVRIIGGPVGPKSGTENFGVLVDGLFTGLEIESFETVPNGRGGAVVQGFGTISSLARPSGLNIHHPTFRSCLDHGAYIALDDSRIAGLTARDTTGSGLRVIGRGNVCGIFKSHNCADGGIELQSFNNGSLAGFVITDYQGVGFNLQPRNGEATDGSISNVTVGEGVIIGKSADADVRTGLRVRCLEASGTTETSQWDISIFKVVIKNAGQSADQSPAVQIAVGTTKTLSRLKLRELTIDTCGFCGITKDGAGELIDPEIDENLILNPDNDASASGSNTHAIRIVAGTITGGSISRNVARDGRGLPKMQSAYSNAATVHGTVCDSNKSFGHTASVGDFGAHAQLGRALERAPR
jgi:hypothetical protein